MKNIKTIEFPNTVADIDMRSYEIGKNCDDIKLIMKSGEMSGIQWFQIIKNNNIIAEIKESVCNLYGEDGVEKDTDCSL